MFIMVNVGELVCRAEVVSELPEIGKPFTSELIKAEIVEALEPRPYAIPQEKQENYAYAVWRVIYHPVNRLAIAAQYVAIHEEEAEKI